VSSTTRPTPVAQTRGTSAKKTVAAKPAVSRSTDEPVATTEAASPLQHAAAVDRPAAGTTDVATSEDIGSFATLMGLFGLLVASMIGALAVLVGRAKQRVAVRVVPVLTPTEVKDAAIEAELQAMIVETKAHGLFAPDALEDAGDDDRRITVPG
jgi:hypothetical protein